ncbi:CDGSH iron-sulfur domain-containing protein [Streptacidiphilus sp. N1-3]|uniref:CDGSH iron-sulfur domain-containing protein n=1 Tax=Streptacidiphilus alkalitolerans TaxID=3342712 RepID=A0ABV6WVV8_9ACTN
MAELLHACTALAEEWEQSPSETDTGSAQRLRARVVRPLTAALAANAEQPEADASPSASSALSPDEQLWELTKSATALSALAGTPGRVLEAAAGLQSLALAGTGDAAADAARQTELAELLTGVPSGIRVSSDGPYLVVGAEELHTHLGEDVPTRPLAALCRCGESADKPWCDGTHATNGFNGAKDPKRVPDRRDSYQGQQVTVLDNRGICAHSGFCTDRLNTVFHAGSEPFVTPSGGRTDQIVSAVRDCPSGALSFAVDGREAREQVDQDTREPVITVSKDGPYRITGAIPLHGDTLEEEVERVAGASREHYSLCRCGHSQNKPFCSGMHWYVNFNDPQPEPDTVPSLFAWCGGYPALLRMTRLFYEKFVPEDPLLSPLFARMSPDHPERVAAWLSQVFEGPEFYSKRYGDYNRMISQHLSKNLTEQQRARWVALMAQSAQDAGLPADAEFRAAFVAYLEWGSRIAAENSQPTAMPVPNMPIPHWWWVCHATPGARVSALAANQEAEEQPAAVALPGPDEPVGYNAHIKDLFRPKDRNSMRFAFDLWSYPDASQYADAILERLGNGTMPCDGAWPAEQVEVFRRWVEAGTPE